MKQKYMPAVAMPAHFIKGGVHYAAIITAVHSATCVNLVVFGRADGIMSEIDTRTSVVYAEDGAEGSWHFPEWLTEGPESVELPTAPALDEEPPDTIGQVPTPPVPEAPQVPASPETPSGASDTPTPEPTIADPDHHDVARMAGEGGTQEPQAGTDNA